jgi:hypothetical protein
MVTTRYIVNNVSGQNIDGDLTINGNITVTGVTNGLLTYRALLTQTPPLSGAEILDFDNKLIIGERYEIINYKGGYVDNGNMTNDGTNYPDGVTTYNTTEGNGSGLQLDVEFSSGVVVNVSVSNPGSDYLVDDEVTLVGGDNNATYQITSVLGDDFSNIADVISGTINKTSCIFIATGFTPTEWSNGTELNSAGDFVVTELENTLGFSVSWSEPIGGVYFAQNDGGPSENSFPRESTQTSVNQNGGLSVINPNLIFQSQVVTDTEIDDSVLLTVFDFGPGDYVSGELYYTPVEINILTQTQQP